MARSFALALLGLMSAAVARADLAPPLGQVRVPLDNVIRTDKSYPEYVFVVVIGGDPAWSYKATLDKDTPLRIAGKGRDGRARLCSLAAVPAEAARQFKTDKELVAAVAGMKVKGVLTDRGASLDSFAVVPKKNAPESIEETYRVERITPEEGIVLAAAKVGRADDPDPHGSAEESMVRWAVAGVAAAVAVCGLGLWLFGRRRTA